MADRVERLTNLLALLLETAEPLSLVQIAGQLDGQYPEGLSARRAAFERDKAALREIGVPIDHEIVPSGAYAGQTRYWIDRQRYELRDLELDPDEARALQVAMAATRPGSTTGQEALWKLGAGMLDRSAPVAAVLPDLPALPALRDATAARHPVEFGYRDRQRRVDPWGVLLQNGFWYLVGFDHGHGERRTYRIDRIATEVAIDGSVQFERPADFDPRAAMPSDPKLLGVDGELREAVVRISPARAGIAVAELGDERVIRRDPDGTVEVSVPCGNLAAFRSWLLGFFEHAVVLEPDDVRAHVVGWLSGAR